MEIQIQASPDDLEDLRQFLYQEASDIELQEISSTAPGELREPILISLIVALGGPVVVTGFVEIVKRWMEHRENIRKMELEHQKQMTKLELQHEERMMKLENQQQQPQTGFITFTLIEENGTRPVELDQLIYQFGN
jgi:hypothetical protein